MTQASRVVLFVGSTNPVKINSVKDAVAAHWPDADVKGYEVVSGVKPQPDSDAETKLGATNRAHLALQAGLDEFSKSDRKFSQKDVVLGLGLEGGIFYDSTTQEMWTTVWVVVEALDGHTYACNGSRFLVPDIVAQRILQGEEMGTASSHISGIENVKHKGGLIGIITDNFTNRTEEYEAIVKLAVGIWYGREWEEHLSP